MKKILIVEDEVPAAKRLAKMLAEVTPEMEITAVCDSIESTLLYLRSNPVPDLIFLDIQLGDGLSFTIFSQLDLHCPVIFTTAYNEYVFKAFELNSIDYLLKPISRDGLSKSIEKYKKLHQPTIPDLSFLANLIDATKPNFKQRFLVNAGASILSLPTSEVAYFYSVEKSTFIAAVNGKSYAVDYSLDKLETVVSSTDFFRVNRQYLVSMTAIKRISIQSKSRMKLTLEPVSADEVCVSNARTHEFRQWLDR